jgi:hypothetical protein
MSFKASIVSLLVLALAAPSTSVAQQLTLESRLRVTAPALGYQKRIGLYRGIHADSLVLDSTAIPIAAISQLDVSWGRKRAYGRGMLVGTAGGLALGALLGAATCTDTDFVMTEGGCTVGIALLGGLVGLGVGGVIGNSKKIETWKPVPTAGLTGDPPPPDAWEHRRDSVLITAKRD